MRNLIEQEVTRFKAEAPANVLPDGFQVFEKLPPIYNSIAIQLSHRNSVTNERAMAALQEEITNLHAVIARLRSDLSDAKEQLRDARLTRVEAAQMRTLGERLQTTLTNVTLVGSLGINLLLFLGIEGECVRYEELRESLETVTKLMMDAKETPNVNRPVPQTEGPKFEKPDH